MQQSNLIEAGCSVSEVKAITGHVTDLMVGYYSEDVDKNNVAYTAIDKFINQNPNLRVIS